MASFARPQPPPQLQPTSNPPPTETLSSPFPVPQKTHTALISGLQTTATRLTFADKVLITLTQPTTSLNHWLHVPLLSESPLTDPSTHIATSPAPPAEEDALDASLLPYPHLTATTVLGGTREDDAMVAQTLAVTVASAVLMKQGGSDGGSRMVVFGFGLARGCVSGRAQFEALVGLCLDVL